MAASERYCTFHSACWEDEDLARRMLLSDPTLIDVRSGLGETVLHDSAVENNANVVLLLLSLGADPNATNFSGNSVIAECASICRIEYDLCDIIELLLKAGANPYLHSELVPCAWHSAAHSSFPRLRQLFRSVPSPPDAHSECEFTIGLRNRFQGDRDEPS